MLPRLRVLAMRTLKVCQRQSINSTRNLYLGKDRVTKTENSATINIREEKERGPPPPKQCVIMLYQ